MTTRTITNGAIRSYKLPKRRGPNGEVFGARTRIRPGQRLPVPAWYFEALLEEKGWRRRMDPKTGFVRGMRGGVGALFEARIKQQRDARAQAEAQERARTAEGQVSSLEQRLAALEREGEARAQAAAEAQERAKAAEARVDELERQRGADPGNTELDPKAKGPDAKADPKPKK